MTSFVAAPQMMVSAATEVAGMRETLDAAHTGAAGQITGLAAAAEDEVSIAIKTLFSDFAGAYLTASAQASTFQAEFTRMLNVSATAFSGAEAAGASSLAHAFGAVPTAVAGSAANIALIMGGSGEPIPTAQFIEANMQRFISQFFPGFNPQALFTPEGNYGLYTGVKSLTLDVSEAQGVQILDKTILQLYPGNNLVIKGESQSSTISSMVMPLLASQHVPNDNIHFVLTGDPNNPNGGLFERLSPLSIPALGITFNGATPDNLYKTTIWTQEYDGFADVPRYPINLISDLNSLAGINYVHPTYSALTQSQLNSAFDLPTVGPTLTDYKMIPTPSLPLLDPLRGIPVIGNPIADLLQPDLRVLVNLGYGDPNYGWSTGPANVPTQFGLFPSLSDLSKVPPLLFTGTQQGFTNFFHDIRTEVGSAGSAFQQLLSGGGSTSGTPGTVLPTLPSLSDVLTAVSPVNLANAVYNATNGVSSAVADIYATALPLVDVGNALFTSLPAYNLQLFAQGVQSGNLVAAIGQPLATDTYLVPLGGAFALFSAVAQLESAVGIGS